MVVHKKGHKNSKGESAEWCIVSHETGKILSSHKSKSAAKKHLSDMHKFKHMKESMEKFNEAKKFLESNGYKLIKEDMNNDEDDWEFTLSQWIFNHYDFDYARSYGPERAYRQVLERLEATMETDGYDVPQSCAEFEEKWGFEVDSTPPDEKWYY